MLKNYYIYLRKQNWILKEPKCQGKFKIVSSGCSFTVEKLIDRVLKDRCVGLFEW